MKWGKETCLPLPGLGCREEGRTPDPIALARRRGGGVRCLFPLFSLRPKPSFFLFLLGEELTAVYCWEPPLLPPVDEEGGDGTLRQLSSSFLLHEGVERGRRGR